MCDLCKEYGTQAMYCVDCGRMICFDVKLGDDIIRPAYITAAGDLRCDICGPQYDKYDEFDYWPPDFEAMPPMEEVSLER